MWRAFSLLVVGLLAAGVYALVVGGVDAHAAGSSSATGGKTELGFALAAGAIALAATLLLSRPRFRFRR